MKISSFRTPTAEDVGRGDCRGAGSQRLTRRPPFRCGFAALMALTLAVAGTPASAEFIPGVQPLPPDDQLGLRHVIWQFQDEGENPSPPTVSSDAPGLPRANVSDDLAFIIEGGALNLADPDTGSVTWDNDTWRFDDPGPFTESDWDGMLFQLDNFRDNFEKKKMWIEVVHTPGDVQLVEDENHPAPDPDVDILPSRGAIEEGEPFFDTTEMDQFTDITRFEYSDTVTRFFYEIFPNPDAEYFTMQFGAPTDVESVEVWAKTVPSPTAAPVGLAMLGLLAMKRWPRQRSASGAA